MFQEENGKNKTNEKTTKQKGQKLWQPTPEEQQQPNITGRSCNRKQHQNFPQQSVGQILGKNKMERGLPVKLSICYDLNHFVDLLQLLFQS